MARPLIARRQVEVARRVGADALAHGCTGKGNDQVRFELTYAAFAPDLPVIAPWREWDIRSREDAIAYAESRGIPIAATRQKIYSRDANLWHLSHEGGILEDPNAAPPDDLLMLTRPVTQAPDTPENVVDRLRARHAGVGQRRSDSTRVDLIAALNAIGGKHGVGVVDLVEDRMVGMKSRGVYETPGGSLLYAAHSELEQLVLDRTHARGEGPDRAALRRSRVRGPLVDHRARGVRRVRQRHAGARHRLGHAAPVQGLDRRRRPRERARAVRRALRHVRRGRRLPAERRGRLHSTVRAAGARPRDQGSGDGARAGRAGVDAVRALEEASEEPALQIA